MDNEICSFYLRGTCKFGSNCRKIHPPLNAGSYFQQGQTGGFTSFNQQAQSPFNQASAWSSYSNSGGFGATSSMAPRFGEAFPSTNSFAFNSSQQQQTNRSPFNNTPQSSMFQPTSAFAPTANEFNQINSMISNFGEPKIIPSTMLGNISVPKYSSNNDLSQDDIESYRSAEFTTYVPPKPPTKDMVTKGF